MSPSSLIVAFNGSSTFSNVNINVHQNLTKHDTGKDPTTIHHSSNDLTMPETEFDTHTFQTVELLCTIIGKMTAATAITAMYKTSILMNTPPRVILTMIMTKITTTVAAVWISQFRVLYDKTILSH